MDTFQTLYFNGDVELKADCLEVLEYRHDWASFHFTLDIFKFFLFSFIPEMILHTRSQGSSFLFRLTSHFCLSNLIHCGKYRPSASESQYAHRDWNNRNPANEEDR